VTDFRRDGSLPNRLKWAWATSADVLGFEEWCRLSTYLSNCQSLTLDLLIARVESDAYAPKPGHPEYEPLIERLTELFHRHAANGVVELQYRTRIFLGKVEQ
jgi:hypothetical protein